METASQSTNSMSSNKVMQESNNTKWTNEQNTWFEGALAIFDTETPERWSNVAALVPGKTELDVIKQYEKLKADIDDIEAGLVPGDQNFNIFRKSPSKFRSSDRVRRKGVPWTEEEHRRFLMGLQVHGKGDWRSISLNFVKTKTSTQVASHAQKYYARQHSDGKEKRRPSIHDMSMVNLPDNTNSLERSSSISGRTAMNYPFEIAKMNNNGGNGINRFEPTRYSAKRNVTPQILSTLFGHNSCECKENSTIRRARVRPEVIDYACDKEMQFLELIKKISRPQFYDHFHTLGAFLYQS